MARPAVARIEKGDPAVALGVYAMVRFVLGFGQVLGELADARRDDDRLLMDEERLPKQVRIKNWSPLYEMDDPGFLYCNFPRRLNIRSARPRSGRQGELIEVITEIRKIARQATGKAGQGISTAK